MIPNPCPECGGDGRVRARRTLTINIPAGVDNGTRIQLAGEGEVGAGNGPPGDLYVEIAGADARDLRRARRRPAAHHRAADDRGGARHRITARDPRRRADARHRGRGPRRAGLTLRGFGVTHLRGGRAAATSSCTSRSDAEEPRRRAGALLRAAGGAARRGASEGRLATHGGGLFCRLRDALSGTLRRDSAAVPRRRGPRRLGAGDYVLDGPEGRHAATVRRIGAGRAGHLAVGGGAVARCTSPASRRALVCGRPVRRRAPCRSRGSSSSRPWPRAAATTSRRGGHRARRRRGGAVAGQRRSSSGAGSGARRLGASGRPRCARPPSRPAARGCRRWARSLTSTTCAARGAGAALAVVLHEDAAAPLAAVAVPAGGEVLLVVGPEGGVSPGRARAAARRRAPGCRLGPTCSARRPPGPPPSPSSAPDPAGPDPSAGLSGRR